MNQLSIAVSPPKGRDGSELPPVKVDTLARPARRELMQGDGSIPTLASNPNRMCGKDLGFFHTRVPAEVPANNYPGSF